MSYDAPLYGQVINAVTRLLEDEEYLPGEPIPSERKLAEMYGVSRTTIKKAIDYLVERKILYKKHGSGTFVQKPEKSFIYFTKYYEDKELRDEEYASFSAQAKSLGLSIDTTVSFQDYIISSNLLDYIFDSKLDNAFCLVRKRSFNDIPSVLEYTYLNVEKKKDLLSIDFTKVSLYDVLKKNNIIITKFKHNIKIVKANKKIATCLNVKKNTSIYLIEFLGLNKKGEIVEYTKSYSRPDQIKINFLTKSKG